MHQQRNTLITVNVAIRRVSTASYVVQLEFIGPGNGSPSATNVVVVVLLLGVVVIGFSKY